MQRRVGEGRTIPLSIAATAPFAALTPPAAVLPPVPTLVVGSAGTFLGVVLYNVTQVCFRQRLCPRPLLGRMNASARLVVWGTMPIDAFAGDCSGRGSVWSRRSGSRSPARASRCCPYWRPAPPAPHR